MLDEVVVRSVTWPDKEERQATDHYCHIMEQQEGQKDAGPLVSVLWASRVVRRCSLYILPNLLYSVVTIENDPRFHCMVPRSRLLLAKYMRTICHSGDKSCFAGILCEQAGIWHVHSIN